jgi:hypothetical protein
MEGKKLPPRDPGPPQLSCTMAERPASDLPLLLEPRYCCVSDDTPALQEMKEGKREILIAIIILCNHYFHALDCLLNSNV